MSYEWIDWGPYLDVSLSEILPDGWTSSENKTCPSTSSSSFSLNFRIGTLVSAILSVLIIRSILQWFVKYKLQYLSRISCFLLICQLLVLLLSVTGHLLNFNIISFSFPTWKGSSVLFFSGQKSLLIVSATTCFIMGIIRYHWTLPFNIIKDCSSVGFSHLEPIAKSRRRTFRDLSSEILKHREPGDLNPVYVNGWIPVIDSRSVVKGKVETVIAVGYKFCVYRGEDGQVFIMDAYCPHMGSDLSAGGKIVGNCIECPFHGWKFDGKTGKCTKIPYTEKIPDLANVKVWYSCERNGYIFVWHHAENEPPTWEVPSVPEIENGAWVLRGRSDYTVHCHIQEIPENGADITHLPQVHSRFLLFGPKSSSEWIKHDWESQWSADEKEHHIARIKLVQTLVMWGHELPYSRFDVDIQQVERDMAVWNNKKYLKNPLLVKEDKLILKFRRWYS